MFGALAEGANVVVTPHLHEFRAGTAQFIDECLEFIGSPGARRIRP